MAILYWICVAAIVVISFVILWEIFIEKYFEMIVITGALDESRLPKYNLEDFSVHPLLTSALCQLCFAISFFEGGFMASFWRYMAIYWIFVFIYAMDKFGKKMEEANLPHDEVGIRSV